MVVKFILVPKIWLNNKIYIAMRGRGQGNPQDFRDVKQNKLITWEITKLDSTPNNFWYSPPTKYKGVGQQSQVQ